MLNFQIPKGKITEPGLHYNISVGIQHIAACLKGTGAVMIFNLIEDAATAEIGGTLLWQWVHHPRGNLDEDRQITAELVLNINPKEHAEFRGVYD